MDLLLTLSDAPDPALGAKVDANFLAYAESKQVPRDRLPLVIRVERDGVLLGGLLGRTLRQWLYVEDFALPLDEQGAGLGRRILAMAEEEALRRGCVGAFLQTVAFQAPAFYERMGYTEFARLPHADPRLTRIWFSKDLAG